MKVANIPAMCVSIRQQDGILYRNTRNLNMKMKVSDILVTSVSIRQQHIGFLRDTRNIYMKVSDILVTSVSIRHHNSAILRPIKYPNIDYNDNNTITYKQFRVFSSFWPKCKFHSSRNGTATT